jgi:poly-gamma-glutamate capsule biosynthesis protein CapA/YwtB (metallophosphatase superfamily)
MVDRRVRLAAWLGGLLVCGSCAAAPTIAAIGPPDSPEAVTVLLAGDAMLGRNVAPVAAADPDGLFADVRREIRRADIAAVNVESPLTNRPHTSPNPYALEADPRGATLLAAAGFDVAGIANNHAGDAGPMSVVDSVGAIGDAGMRAVGGGINLTGAWAPVIVEKGGVKIAFLAIDGSRQGLAATASGPGVASWDPDRARSAIVAARSVADVVIVGLHGGVEYRTRPDPLLGPIADELAAMGADVVWGHGPHVEQPISVTVAHRDGDERPTVIATSLGNFLFDQRRPGTDAGILLEVLVDRSGVVAHRVGDVDHHDLRVHFNGWRPPDGDAALVAGGLWNLDRPVALVDTSIDLPSFSEGAVVNAGTSDLDGDGIPEFLVSYRHPLRDKPGEPGPPPQTDPSGMSAHLGVIEADGTPIWLSRRPPHPVGYVAACDGGAAFAYTALDDDTVISTGVGVWSGFGFVLEAELSGPGTIGCADVDGDGRLDPVIVGRSVGEP